MSDEEREVREALPGTTPPPWTPEMQFTERDFALIPKLVRGVPKLIAEIDRLRAANDRLLDAAKEAATVAEDIARLRGGRNERV